MRTVTIIALLGLLGSPAAAAQDSPPTVTRGSQVRLYDGSAFATGRLDDITDTTIVILDGYSRRVFARSSVLQLQVRQSGSEWRDVSLAGLRLAPMSSAPAMLNVGDRVRLSYGRRRDEGTLLAVRSDSVVVHRRADGCDIAVSLAAIDRIERYGGRRGHASSGFLIGFALGALGGAVVVGEACASQWGPLCGASPAVWGAAGGAALGLIGAVIGTAIRSDSWLRVPTNRLRLEAVTGERGLGLRMGIRF